MDPQVNSGDVGRPEGRMLGRGSGAGTMRRRPTDFRRTARRRLPNALCWAAVCGCFVLLIIVIASFRDGRVPSAAPIYKVISQSDLFALFSERTVLIPDVAAAC